MLLHAPELLSIALCAGPAGSELVPIDAINEASHGKLYGTMQTNAAARATILCRVCTRASTRIQRVHFASMHDLMYGRRASLLVLKMRGLHHTNSIRALGRQF